MPPASPAIAPHSMPITMPMNAAKKPTSSAAWPPFISRPSLVETLVGRAEREARHRREVGVS